MNGQRAVLRRRDGGDNQTDRAPISLELRSHPQRSAGPGCSWRTRSSWSENTRGVRIPSGGWWKMDHWTIPQAVPCAKRADRSEPCFDIWGQDSNVRGTLKVINFDDVSLWPPTQYATQSERPFHDLAVNRKRLHQKIPEKMEGPSGSLQLFWWIAAAVGVR